MNNEPAKIDRWDMVYDWVGNYLAKKEDGDWVKYDDHEAAMQEAKEEIGRLQSRIEGYQSAFDEQHAHIAELEKVVEAVKLFKDHADNPKSWDNDSWDRVESALAALDKEDGNESK